jgi:hypothetical protein
MDYNPLSTMMTTMRQHGANIEIKQRLPDGSYQTAPNGTLQALGSQARLAATASALQNHTKEEKINWAIEKRIEGNNLFQQKLYSEAIERYLECLTATDFGQENEEKNQEEKGNIDEVVVPVLCNLAACCIQTKVQKEIIFLTSYYFYC